MSSMLVTREVLHGSEGTLEFRAHTEGVSRKQDQRRERAGDHPYGREISAWMRKAWESAQSSAELVVCLVPARPGSGWWHDYAMRGEVRFLRGRIRFNGQGPAPFDSAVVVFRNAESVTKPALEEAT
jgi:hypothetical protein